MSGWIYDFRQELESNIWIMPPMYHRVWQWIKYSVNHSDFGIPNKDGSTTIIKAGQRATSYRQIAKGVGYYEGKSWKEPNVKTIKSILDWMVKQKMISVMGNTEGTIITIEKWELYQKDMVKGNTERITTATRRKHLPDTNNKGLINDELMNKEKHIPDIDEIRKALPKEMIKVSKSKSKLKDALKEHGKDKLINAIKEYEQEVTERRNKGFKDLQFMNESTFWNGRYIDYLDSCQEEKTVPGKPVKLVVKSYEEGLKAYDKKQG